jgi:hypothetical protein
MSRFRRGLLAFLALVLLHLSPASAKPADQWIWTGSVVHNDEQTYGGYVSPPYTYLQPTTWYEFIHYRRSISINGDGTALESTTYIRYYRYTEWAGDPNDPNQLIQCTYRGWYSGESNNIIQTSVYIDNTIVDVSNDIDLKVAQRDHDIPACWTHGDFYMPNATEFYGEAIRPWNHNGAFSANDTAVAGRDVYAQTHYSDNLVYPGSIDHEVKFTSYDLFQTKIDTPWFSPETKTAFSESSRYLEKFSLYTICAGVSAYSMGQMKIAVGNEVVSVSASAAALIDGELAYDPPDPNFTEIALPVTPSISQQPFTASNELSPAQAAAFNALIENEEGGIGLARAILTSTNRASGALEANDTYWVDQQLQAARTYAGQLSTLLEAHPQLLETLKQALLTDPNLTLDITREDLEKYKYDLITNGLSAEQVQMLTDLGVDQHGQAQVLNALLDDQLTQDAPSPATYAVDSSLNGSPQDILARFPDLLADPELNQSTQQLAMLLREYSLGAGWKVRLPLIMR